MESQLATLTLDALVIMGSPGPSTISATAMGASFGIRRSLHYVFGLITGTIAVLLAVAAGVVAVLVAIPGAAVVLGGAATVYMVYLAYRIATAPPLATVAQPRAAPGFAGGALLAVANPKAYLAIAAVFAATTLVAGDRTRDAAAKTILLSAMIVLIHVVWLLAGASLARVLQDPVTARTINRALAAALVVATMLTLLG